ncbi:hypothetical protein PGTUg99_004985 [Puccinia graminis f. sp. tritici]|uniref:Uncharacterized protein n=1 Tax=Puccinia graminis f. sp. tritici TaxID=56615 RepID=A0A5B0QYC6_PUCGR|nr:hypothetical protein PGTUg99_004985 [Puccinia graminis f. sp. tritici]
MSSIEIRHSHANHDPLTGSLRQHRQNQFSNNNQMIHNPYMNQQSHATNNFSNNSNYNNNNYNNNQQPRNNFMNGGGQFYNQGYNKSNGYEGNKRPRGGYRGSNYSENPQGKADGNQGGKRNNQK